MSKTISQYLYITHPRTHISTSHHHVPWATGRQSQPLPRQLSEEAGSTCVATNKVPAPTRSWVRLGEAEWDLGPIVDSMHRYLGIDLSYSARKVNWICFAMLCL